MNTSTSRGITTNNSEFLAIPPLATRYEALVRLSRAIGAHRDPKELFGVLVEELRGILPFDLMAISCRDQDCVTFRNYCIDVASRSALDTEKIVALDDLFSSWVCEKQEPLLRSTDDMEPRYGRLQRALKRLKLRSICALRLTTAHRKLGAISFGSNQVDTYSSDEISFMSQVADQIALALDDALNFTALRQASEELQSKNDRLQLLLDLTNQLVSNLELRDLLRTLAGAVRRVLLCDAVGVALANPNGTELRSYMLDFPETKGFLREEMTFPWDSAAGVVYRRAKPMLLEGVSRPINANFNLTSLEDLK